MDFEFIVVNTPNYNYIRNTKENRIKHHYYVLKLTAHTIYKLADKYEIECYHFTKKVISLLILAFSQI